MSNIGTLRLLFPQWQGGDNPDYILGARLLAWLAPARADHLQVEVPVEPPSSEPLSVDNGILGRKPLLRQLEAAHHIIMQHRPERIIVFGGDCLIDQAPFAYLSERYGNGFGVLWIDAHPDVASPNHRDHAHTMVLGNLLGHGDSEFASHVSVPISPDRVLFAGLGRLFPHEAEFIEEHGIQASGPEELALGPEHVLNWIRERRIRHLAIHLDLDVFDPLLFGGVSFAKPGMDATTRGALRSGSMNFDQISQLLLAVCEQVNVVGLGIAEHIPWDAIHLRNLMADIQIFRS